MFDLQTYTLFHVVLSLVGIVAGLVVVGGLMSGVRLDRWTHVFLATTLLTSITGFGFPFTGLLPSHMTGIVSLIVLVPCFMALYLKGLGGGWRKVYVITAVTALWLNVFVLLAQLFLRVPALNQLGPTPKDPAFAITQLMGLVLFIVIGRAAWRGFRN
ncbi:MAG TPA: hypothetical protein VHB46_03165 [Burkholderiales bacterium]|nr:hypothetical protein [Burkholderiales bacterium]